jgi:hypothetical protein
MNYKKQTVRLSELPRVFVTMGHSEKYLLYIHNDLLNSMASPFNSIIILGNILEPGWGKLPNSVHLISYSFSTSVDFGHIIDACNLLAKVYPNCLDLIDDSCHKFDILLPD